MLLIILIFILCLLISYPIIGYKIFKAIRRKNKRKAFMLSGLLLILIVVPGFYLRILPSSGIFWKPVEKIEEKNYNEELTGLEFKDGNLIYEYESERFFNGDGYSIWIYELTENTSKYFKNPSGNFYREYPSTEIREHWQTEFWKKTPIKESEQIFLDFAHSSLDKLDFELEDLLEEKGNYYSYIYYLANYDKDKSIVVNIDFFIVCPDRRLIVKINHNT